ncbi:nickel/cobalt transporter [Beijerinckia indica]|uniref:Nickel/cobalt efflux system n=1 Tax=Beijerinckia indica subsp. indica (strain ATCC 9039 / DSM 1715 / NCIMB 8712) TaxID=395963 RepID=B2IB40_BEII9|nr:nickel/cobalt transporter [Beijerinckia indica]ACB93740.1 high-affinity nickel-transporter [Beijerinckia indica subsp. indica ATCC 9039]
MPQRRMPSLRLASFGRPHRLLVLTGLILCGFAMSSGFAQGVHHPFAVGVNEGAASTQGVFGFLLGEESRFYQRLTAALRASRTDGGAAATLIALSFAYGIFHAAGPGHGKAVISAYLLANEKMVRRGLVLSFCAALLQAGVAIALVTIAAMMVHATARQMTDTAHILEIASYAGMAILGASLTFNKSKKLVAMVLAARDQAARKMPAGLVFTPAGASSNFTAAPRASAFKAESVDPASPIGASTGAQAFACDDGCNHLLTLAPDASDKGIKSALLAVLAAGTRPCSGAILVLIFALSQGIFLTGVSATLAMALGTAITTGALALLTVFAKTSALKLVAAKTPLSGGPYGPVLLSLFEMGAALLVLLFGLVMLGGNYFGKTTIF